MPMTSCALVPGPRFWPEVAQHLLKSVHSSGQALSDWLILVPHYPHIAPLRQALQQQLGASFIPPQIRTLDSWLELQRPDENEPWPASQSERLLDLYAGLRQSGMVKQLLTAKHNVDLLPLARTLIKLSDELSAALLPSALAQPELMEDKWRAALHQLSPRTLDFLSGEAQLVWTLWQGERDPRDPALLRHKALQRLAAQPKQALLWCGEAEPKALEAAFLQQWALHQEVVVLTPDWSSAGLPPLLVHSWPELVSDTAQEERALQTPSGLGLIAAHSLEDEAQAVAQTVVDWVAAGKSRIALVPQDRLVARRVRALLERADIVVADEGGWKLSTTRAAAVLHAWLELVASGGEVAVLLDFLKSPFIHHEALTDPEQRQQLESALMKLGVRRNLDLLAEKLFELPSAQPLISAIATTAKDYRSKKTVAEWVAATRAVFDTLECTESLKNDGAGVQVLAMLERLGQDCESLKHAFNLSEWRTLLDLQMEQTAFVASKQDRRVMMVPLTHTSLREFDAAIVVGADAEHLPARSTETLFFANAVRRELGLETREEQQRTQLRAFASLLQTCPEVILSWQAVREGEAIAPSVWIQRLELSLLRAGLAPLPRIRPHTTTLSLHSAPSMPPMPTAAHLLPDSLSASAYNDLYTCPYRFFALRMLQLRAPNALEPLPSKRDYGVWLHEILSRYHAALQRAKPAPEDRYALMEAISEEVFTGALENQPAALGFHASWRSKSPAYVDWANQREAEGWCFEFGELSQTKSFSYRAGEVTLYGKPDRVDLHADGQRMLLDYKTSHIASLKSKIKKGSDHQLPFYSLLLDPAPLQAAYLALDEDLPKCVDLENFENWREQLQSLLAKNLNDIVGGAPLPANGVGKSCDYCEVKGLCRKGAW